jgi:hypothetical protein
VPGRQTYPRASRYVERRLSRVFPPWRDRPLVLRPTATRLAFHMFIRLSISVMFTTSAAALEATHMPSTRAVQQSPDLVRHPGSIVGKFLRNHVALQRKGRGEQI